ncbi:MAG: hypothetical protein QOG87_2103 [Actinomycetota bacterium]|jgi:DNA-binding MarR family transcriptional regulator
MRFEKHFIVLRHLVESDFTTPGETAMATGLSVHEARAMLKSLAKRGLAFERLGAVSRYEAEEVPRGRYVITDEGRWELKRHRSIFRPREADER